MTYELSIETPSLTLDIRGERREVERAYAQLRGAIVDQLRTHLDPESTPESAARAERYETPPTENVPASADEAAEMEETLPLHRVESPSTDTDAIPNADARDAVDVREREITLIVRRPHYLKAYVLERADLETSPLGRVLDGRALRRIHADASLDSWLDPLADRGSTLWRRLTTEGRSVVETEDREGG